MGLICANLLTNVLYIAIALAVLLLMVLIHELGHYIVGRALGFKITEFSIGFGKAIFQRKNKRGELISIRIFPLGGYCAFDGEGDDDESSEQDKSVKTENTKDNDKKTEIISQMHEIAESKVQTDVKTEQPKQRDWLTFNEQKPWKRILVYLAGVTFNFLSAILFSFILLLSYGYDIQKVSSLDTNYASLYGELQVGDVIWAVNDKDVNFATNGTLPTLLNEIGADKDITLRVNRDGKDINIVIRLSSEEVTASDGTKSTKIISGFKTESYRHNFIEALGRSFVLAGGFGWVVIKSFGMIFTGAIPLTELGGPITTIGAISSIAQSGFANFLILLPLLAANLAVFNIIPFPALDGSHIIFTIIEWIRGKPLNRKVENYIHAIGLIVLLVFVVGIEIVHIFV